jgi:hypothetical protein
MYTQSFLSFNLTNTYSDYTRNTMASSSSVTYTTARNMIDSGNAITVNSNNATDNSRTYMGSKHIEVNMSMLICSSATIWHHFQLTPLLFWRYPTKTSHSNLQRIRNDK